MAKVKITLVRSPIGRPADQGATAKALGLHRLNQSVTHELTPAIQGMITKIQHLIQIQNV